MLRGVLCLGYVWDFYRVSESVRVEGSVLLGFRVWVLGP